ncbi:DUF805 domain-containing protein [Brevibacterium salitolerans]|mgnify:CR=1 FL=1|uniref:DUF805 domain-containing protein n=1 Tax=Brevibacterium salitolerans TaxID=1403566 RepID=A0ABP5IS04_9MICO
MSHGSNPYNSAPQGGQPPYGSGPSQPYGSGPVPPPAAPQSGGQPGPGGAPYGSPQGAPYGAPQGGPQGGAPYGAPQGAASYGGPQNAYATSKVTVLPGGPQATGPDGQPALSQPLYGATFKQAVVRFFKKYARFSGYASLSEYWWAYLGVSLIGIVLSIPLMIGYFMMMASLFSAAATADPYTSEISSGAAAGAGVGGILVLIGAIISGLFGLAVIVPQLAASARRLHDAGFSAFFLFLHLVPSVGSLIVLVLTILPTKPEARRAEWDDVRGD